MKESGSLYREAGKQSISITRCQRRSVGEIEKAQMAGDNCKGKAGREKRESKMRIGTGIKFSESLVDTRKSSRRRSEKK